MQRIALTVPRDIEAFLNQTIDRFSIGWYWTPPLCSVCGTEWLSRECNHWPGRKYRVGDNGKQQILCELVFVQPAGKETSAVNTPAVDGTGIRGVLAELMAAKESLSVLRDGTEGREFEEGRGMNEEEQTPAVVSDAVSAPLTKVAGTMTPAAPAVAAVAPPAPGLEPNVSAATLAVVQELVSQGSALLTAQREAVLDNRLAAAGLPVALQESVRAMLPAGWRVGDLDRLIETFSAACGRRWRLSARCRGMTRRATTACAA